MLDNQELFLKLISLPLGLLLRCFFPLLTLDNGNSHFVFAKGQNFSSISFLLWNREEAELLCVWWKNKWIPSLSLGYLWLFSAPALASFRSNVLQQRLFHHQSLLKTLALVRECTYLQKILQIIPWLAVITSFTAGYDVLPNAKIRFWIQDHFKVQIKIIPLYYTASLLQRLT